MPLLPKPETLLLPLLDPVLPVFVPNEVCSVPGFDVLPLGRLPPPCVPVPPVLPAAMAARSVAASFTASAFLR
ncbi:MAG: hypothetical protein QM777_04580 [Pseudorhodoferax sp.]